MLGQPASSQTVCRPSRRTSDFSPVYSGPVRSRVLIHSGLRSIGTWLLRTSRRSSLRPAGSTLVPAGGVGTAGSLMSATVPPAHDRPGRAELVPGRPRGSLPQEGSCGFSGCCPRLASGVPPSPRGESVVLVASVAGFSAPGPSVTPVGPAVGVSVSLTGPLVA